jgi:DNA-binding CsgD family transcriptional regulator
VHAVFEAVAGRLSTLVPCSGSAWVSTDPATGLPAGAIRLVESPPLTPGQCAEMWYREFLVEDVNRFDDLRHDPRPVATLRQAVDDPDASPRYRQLLRPMGLSDELRAVLRAGDAAWATLTMWRRDGEPPFDADEIDLVADLTEPLGQAVRNCARNGSEAWADAERRPGLLVFGRDGALLSVSEAAPRWLEEADVATRLPGRFGVDVPMWVLATVFAATAADDGVASTRIRARSGGWLHCHASCLRDRDGEVEHVGVVIGPAEPSKVTPLLVDAYDLTERERDVTALVARGAGTNEIADELFLSVHTVRDHVKAIFQKVGVTSRGELVARLFADHVVPTREASIVRV